MAPEGRHLSREPYPTALYFHAMINLKGTNPEKANKEQEKFLMPFTHRPQVRIEHYYSKAYRFRNPNKLPLLSTRDSMVADAFLDLWHTVYRLSLLSHVFLACCPLAKALELHIKETILKTESLALRLSTNLWGCPRVPLRETSQIYSLQCVCGQKWHPLSVPTTRH